jgi:hypothetical protein
MSYAQINPFRLRLSPVSQAALLPVSRRVCFTLSYGTCVPRNFLDAQRNALQSLPRCSFSCYRRHRFAAIRNSLRIFTQCTSLFFRLPNCSFSGWFLFDRIALSSSSATSINCIMGVFKLPLVLTCVYSIINSVARFNKSHYIASASGFSFFYYRSAMFSRNSR